MPTPAERKALLFLAGVIVLGASVRVVRAARDDHEPPASAREALARQLAAVDSASEAVRSRASSSRSRSKGGGRRVARSSGRDSVASAGSGSRDVGVRRAVEPESKPPPIIDLDAASASDIETLPRIGPVLAHRIVDDRARNGPFGSLDGFQRVRGVGPAMAAALAARVTFSGTVRPSNAVVDPRLRRSPPPTPSLRRERRRTPT